jgi:hypothetical protein
MQVEDTATAPQTPDAPAAGETQQIEAKPSEGEQPEQQQSDAAADNKQEAKETPDAVQRRFNRITREKYEARARADFLQKQVDELSARLSQTAQPEPTAPATKQIDPDEQRTLIEINAHAIALLNRAGKEAPGFREDLQALQTAPIPISADLALELMEHENAIPLIRHLASDLEEAERIASLPTRKAVREIDRLAERLTTPKKSAAPQPLSPVRSASVPEKDPEKMSDAEWSKFRREQSMKKE